MNKVRSRIDKELNKITDITYEVRCVAVSGSTKAPVNLTVLGLEGEVRNEQVLEHLRYVAAVDTASKIPPEVFDRAMNELPCPDQCKAWIIAVLWFAFSDSVKKSEVDAWLNVYRKWDEKYDNEYQDKAKRNEMLMLLGLPEKWIKKCSVSKTRLDTRLHKLGV